MKPLPPEFLGIQFLYLESKAVALGTAAALSLLLAIASSTILITRPKEVSRDFVCPEKTIAIMESEGKITCVLERVSPYARTIHIEPGWIDRIPDTKKK